MKSPPPKEILVKQYNLFSMGSLAYLLNVSKTTIKEWFDFYKIPIKRKSRVWKK